MTDVENAGNKGANKFFEDFANGIANGINVAKLGKVKKFYPETMKVDVLPLPSEDNALIINVPVATVRCSDFLIYYPFKEGDMVVLLFIDNDSDNILMGEDSAQTERGHDVSDCICIGGITLLKDTLSVNDKDDLTIQNISNSCSIAVKKDGKIEIKGTEIKIEASKVSIDSYATYKGKEIAVKGDVDTRGDALV